MNDMNTSSESLTESKGILRRKELLKLIKESPSPVSGSKLGTLTGVSRQIVVSDIALLKTQGYPIVSTARGYIYSDSTQSDTPTRIFKVYHTDEQVADELETIIDLGGCVLNVIVNHRTYGKVTAPLNIKSRRDINRFISDLDSSKSTLLSNITSGYHFHTVSAESYEILDEIEEALGKKNYLATILDYEKDSLDMPSQIDEI